MKFKIIFALARDDGENQKAESMNMESMSDEELREHAGKMGVNVNPSMKKQDIIRALKNKHREMKEA